MGFFQLEDKEKRVKDLPEKFQQGFKIDITKYNNLKKCVLKREAGIEEDSCHKIFKDLGIDEA